jgi:hypothetical protein
VEYTFFALFLSLLPCPFPPSFLFRVIFFPHGPDISPPPNGGGGMVNIYTPVVWSGQTLVILCKYIVMNM